MANKEYPGLTKVKPVFEGLSRYRQPSNYELSGKALKLVFDGGGDYSVNFSTGTELEWKNLETGEVRSLHYECAKTDELTYFVNFEYPYGNEDGRINPVLILDFEQSLVTNVQTKTRYNPKYPTMVVEDIFFGAIERPGALLPNIRHSYTKDLVGKRIHWHYAPDVEIVHVYHNEKTMTIDFPKHVKEMQKTAPPPDPTEPTPVPSEDGLDYFKNGYEEPVFFVKIKKNLYVVSVCEQNKATRGLSGNSMLFLMDTERCHDVGRSYGHKGDHITPENYMFAAYGDFVGEDY